MENENKLVLKDHPRLCGEKLNDLKKQVADLGSPPPMRGKVTFLIDTVFPARITPAYAGKSERIFRKEICSRDHPRLCGEKPSKHTCFPRCLGSPPPMRGKVRLFRGKGLLLRITPAYAGKSPAAFSLPHDGQDHPRLCGEKSFHSSQLPIPIGSPPPMRGKVVFL